MKAFLVFEIIGISTIVLFMYLGYVPAVFQTSWKGTSMFPVCAIILDLCLFIELDESFQDKQDNILFKTIEYIGKRSYCIFLVQMMYYAFFAEYINVVISSVLLRLCINVMICVFVGCVLDIIVMPMTNVTVNAFNCMIKRKEAVRSKR